MTRRVFIGAVAALAAPSIAAARESEIEALERRYGGRLGVYALDLGSRRIIAHRADEAFPMCSTFKVLAAGAILQRVARHQESLARTIAYSSRDILSYAPIAKSHLDRDGTGAMTLEQACAAAVEWSDNTAANLLLRALGGPNAVTAFARSLGDPHTRLDRTEPALNTAVPGDPRDTTTPAAMAADVRETIFGAALGRDAAHLRAWMLACRTADARIPAGLPKRWRSGNKTGTGDHATANDVAFLLPPTGAPKIVAAYFTGSRADEDAQNDVLAAVGRLVTRRFG